MDSSTRTSSNVATEIKEARGSLPTMRRSGFAPTCQAGELLLYIYWEDIPHNEQEAAQTPPGVNFLADFLQIMP